MIRCWDVEMSDQTCAAPSLTGMTPKQKEAVRLLVDCHSTKEIARRLNISPSTVEQRLASVRRKYGLLSRRDVQRYFRHLGIAKLEGVFDQTSAVQVAISDVGPDITIHEQTQPAADTRPNPPLAARQLVLIISLVFLLGCATTILATLFGVMIGQSFAE